MTLDEIKTAITERIDTAWNEVKDQVDADKVRTYVQGLTAELTSHVYAVEAALVDHVLGKQETPAPAPVPAAPVAPAVSVEPTTSTEQPTADVAAAPAGETAVPAPSTPDSSAQANPTGMAANPPAETNDAPPAPAAGTEAQ